MIVSCTTDHCLGKVYSCFSTRMCQACQRRVMLPPAPVIALNVVQHATRSRVAHANKKTRS